MNEQEQKYIYGQLKYLTETVDALFTGLEKQQGMIENLVRVIDKMQSPEYAKKQSDVARSVDIVDKINLMRNMKK